MTRIVATSDLTFYADPVNGLASNDGLSALTPLPEIQDCVDRLYSDYDLADKYTATVSAAAGTYTRGLSFSGRLRGARAPGNLKITGAGPTSTVVQPSASGVAGAEINYGAAVTLDNFGLNMTSGQDGIITGKDVDFSIGNLRWTNIAAGHNYITQTESSRMTVLGNLWLASDAQCFLQMDQFSTAYWNTNGIPNQLAIWLDSTALGRFPHWADAFLDVCNSNCNIQNIDYHGWNGADMGVGPNYATGYRLRLRSGGVCNLNSLGVSTLPGSADSAWPYQGYVL